MPATSGCYAHTWKQRITDERMAVNWRTAQGRAAALHCDGQPSAGPLLARARRVRSSCRRLASAVRGGRGLAGKEKEDGTRRNEQFPAPRQALPALSILGRGSRHQLAPSVWQTEQQHLPNKFSRGKHLATGIFHPTEAQYTYLHYPMDTPTTAHSALTSTIKIVAQFGIHILASSVTLIRRCK